MELKVQTSYKSILGIALPIAFAMVVPQINFITNTIFLGALGNQELASAGIAGVYYLIFAVVGNGLNNGLQSLIARRAGQGLPKEIGKLFYHGIWIAMIFSFIGIAITYSVAPFILRSVIHSPEIAEQVIHFLFIRIWGLPFLYLYTMRNALLVGTNQTKLLVWGSLAEALVNILLDYALIYGHGGLPALGFDGAAYSSIVAEASGLFVIYRVIHAKGMHRSFAFFEKILWDGSIAKRILVQSLPLIAQYAISIISWEYFYILIEHHGEQALAISHTMRTIFGLFGIFSWSFAATSNNMVSNLIGQGKTEDVIPVIKRIVKVSFVISFSIFTVLNIVPQFFLQVYSQGDDFILAAIPVVRIVSVALLLMSVGTVWLNAVTGTGNTLVNLMIEGITIVMYCVYVYLILEHFNLPITWGWVSEWVYWLSMFSMSFLYMRSGKWKGKKI